MRAWLLAGAALLLWPLRARAEVVPGLRIGTVSINTDNIFSAEQERSLFLYGWANAIHFTTHDKVVRRELLFSEGEPYDPELLQETERNLRQYPFLRRASVSASAPHDGVVDVDVRTSDSWTLEPRADFKKVAGQSTLRLGVVENNLLGMGKNLSVLYLKDSYHGDNRTLSWEDPQFLGRRLDLSLDALDSRQETSFNVKLSRPYYATIAGWSASAGLGYDDKEQPFYSGTSQLGNFRKTHREGSFSFSKGVGSTPSLVRTLSFGLSPQSDEFRSADPAVRPLLPADSRRIVLAAGASWQRVRYIKENRIQKFDRDEDFNMGTGVAVNLGLAPKALGSTQDQLTPSLSWSSGRSFGPGRFALAGFKLKSELASRRISNQLATLTASYFHRVLSRSTLALQATYDQGTHLDPDRTLLLGGDTGLHAYPIAAFSGNRRFLFNAEQRVFLAEDVFHLFSFGAAAFFDSGAAWQEGRNMKAHDLRSSYGAGFRLAFSRSSGDVPIRFDLARAVNSNGTPHRWVFSIQTGQSFGP